MYLIQSTFARRRRRRDGVGWCCAVRRSRRGGADDAGVPRAPLFHRTSGRLRFRGRRCSVRVCRTYRGTYYVLYTAAGSVYAPFLRGSGNNAQSPSLYYDIAGPTIAIVRIYPVEFRFLLFLQFSDSWGSINAPRSQRI